LDLKEGLESVSGQRIVTAQSFPFVTAFQLFAFRSATPIKGIAMAFFKKPYGGCISTMKRASALIAVGAMILCCSAAASAAPAVFGNVSLSGGCGLNFVSTDSSNSTILGVLDFNGAGGLSGNIITNSTASSAAPSFTAINSGGTYRVFSDGTMQADFSTGGGLLPPVLGTPVTTYSFTGAITFPTGGEPDFELRLLNRASGTAGTGVCRAQLGPGPSFTDSSITGTCGLNFALVNSSGVVAAATGLMTFDGSGGLQGDMAFNTTSSSGPPVFNAFSSGANYAVSSDGTANLNFSIGSQPFSYAGVIDKKSSGYEVRLLDKAKGTAGTGVCTFQSTL
jgi:hypothetical protein